MTIPILSSLQPKLVEATRIAMAETIVAMQLVSYSLIETATLSITITKQLGEVNLQG